MAREYARVKVTIWADGDFRRLSDSAQALYFRLLSSPTMTLCGVADWRPNRLAALTAGVSPDDVRLAAKELAERGYVVIDDETEEILVRTFIRHDGLIKTPNIAAAMVKDYAGTASALLRGVIVHELHKLKEDEPEMKGWAIASKLLSEPSIDPSENPSPKASGNPSGNPSPIHSGDASGNGSHIPHPASLNPQPLEGTSKKEAPRTRGTRLPDDFALTDEMRQWAKDKGYGAVDLDAATEEFCDYWRAVAGSKGVKLDWIATWRNDIRRKAEWLGGRPTAAHPAAPSPWDRKYIRGDEDL